MKTAMLQLKKFKIVLDIFSAFSKGRNRSLQTCRVQSRPSASDHPLWVGGINVYPAQQARR